MNSMILANSNSVVSWTILTGIATIGVAVGGYGWLKQQDKNIPGLLSIACVGVLIMVYGVWGTTSTSTFYYSNYFFIFPAVAIGIVYKAATSPDTPKANGPRQPNSTLFERSARLQTSPQRSLYPGLAAAVQKDAMRDTLSLRLDELERFMGESFQPTQWCFVGTEIITTNGVTTAWAGHNGVEKLDEPVSVQRHESGRVQSLHFGDKTFSPVRPEANVTKFVNALTKNNESRSDV